VQLYVPVSAFDAGFGEFMTIDDDAALEAGGSLADDSMEVRCAGNSGVRFDCLLIVRPAIGAVPKYGLGNADRFDGSDGATKLKLWRGALDKVAC
jgi:hypothetical protein